MSEQSWDLFKGWVQALAEAQTAGECDIPAIHDLDAVVEWLHDRDELHDPVGIVEARIIIEACLKGGVTQVKRA